VAKLNQEIGTRPTGEREKLANKGIDPTMMGPEEFQTFVKSDTVSMAQLAKALDLKPQ
jgi:tripartite-type tricarboxylate transporter receptor subunit TctC